MFRQLVLPVGILIAFPALAADYNVTATGRCVYEENGRQIGVPGARVELRDQEFWLPPAADVIGPTALDLSVNQVCAVGESGPDGSFTLSGRCGDPGPAWLPWTKPDLYVRCSLHGRAGRIFGGSFPFTLYNTATAPRQDDDRPLQVGAVKLPAGAAKVFLSLNYTYDRVTKLVGGALLPVWVMYPGGHEAVVANTGQHYFASYAGAVFMSMAPGQEGHTVAHEYGHTLQFQSFLADWSTINSVLNVLRAGWAALRDRPGAGHTLRTISNPVMAFAEGWAEFMEGVVYGSGLPNCATWTEIGATEAEKIMVEGNVACRLWRLYQRYGYRDVWTAQTRSKAARYDHFFADFLRIHPEAASVAVPAPALAGRSMPIVIAPPPRVVAQPIAVVQPPARPPAAPTFVAQLRLTPKVAQSVAKAEGSSCKAIRDTYAFKAQHLSAACPRLQDPGRKGQCLYMLARMQRRQAALDRFCPAIATAAPR